MFSIIQFPWRFYIVSSVFFIIGFSILLKYICFGKNFNPDENRTVFYIILLDDEPTDRASFRTIVTTNGCIKIDLRGIWVDAGLSRVTSKYLNATLKCTADSDDGNVYEFVVL